MNKSIKKAMIYPFHAGLCCFVRYLDMLPYDEFVLVSPKGYGFENKDVGTIDRGGELGLKVTSDFEESIKKVSEVIFTKPTDDISDKIQLSIRQKKNITCLFSLEDETEIIKQCNNNSLEYKNYSKNRVEIDISEKRLFQFDTPILLVCGMSEKTQKFDIQLTLKRELEKLGYSISQVGSRSYSSIFSMHNFPDYLLKQNDEMNKITYFNNYIKFIETTEKPDVIIIGIPGGIIPYDLNHNNRFGILAYMVCQTISIDYAILSLANDYYDSDFYDFIQQYSKYKYGFKINMLHLSNVYHDIYGDERIDGERAILLGSDNVSKRKKELDFETYNIFQENDITLIIENVINELGGD